MINLWGIHTAALQVLVQEAQRALEDQGKQLKANLVEQQKLLQVLKMLGDKYTTHEGCLQLLEGQN